MKKIFLLLIILSYQIVYSQWESSNEGLFGNTVSCFLTTDGEVFAGTNIGVYLSTDGGATWSLTKLKSDYIYCLLKVDNRIFAGGFKGLYYTDDNGASWTYSGAFSKRISSLAAADGVIYAGTQNGAYRSTDNGMSWTPSSNGLSLDAAISFLIKGENVYCACNYSLYKSSDKGNLWKRLDLGVEHTGGVWDIETSSDKIFAALGIGLFVSKNEGDTWQKIKLGSDVEPVQRIITRNHEIYVYTSYGLYFSSDAGENWSKLYSNLPCTVYDLALVGENILVGSYSKGILKSTDHGQTWFSSNIGLTDLVIKDLASNGSALLASSESDDIVFYSSNKGTTWNTILNDVSAKTSVVFFHNAFYASSYNSGIYVSHDNCATWNLNNDKVTMVNNFVKVGDVLYAFGDAQYRTVDGENWENLSFPSPKINSVVSFKEKIYVVSNNTIYALNNNEINWENKTKGLGNTSVHSLKTKNGRLYAGTMTGVFVLQDDENWVLCSEGITNLFIYALEITGIENDKLLLAGSKGGLFVSSDEGMNWINKTGDLPDSAISNVSVIDNSVYVGLSIGGLYRAKLSDLGINGTVDSESANDLKLFPNPASDFLTVEFKEKAPLRGNIIISDILGAAVLEVPAGGEKLQRIDLSSLPKGVYCLRAGNESRIFVKS